MRKSLLIVTYCSVSLLIFPNGTSFMNHHSAYRLTRKSLRADWRQYLCDFCSFEVSATKRGAFFKISIFLCLWNFSFQRIHFKYYFFTDNYLSVYSLYLVNNFINKKKF